MSRAHTPVWTLVSLVSSLSDQINTRVSECLFFASLSVCFTPTCTVHRTDGAFEFPLSQELFLAMEGAMSKGLFTQSEKENFLWCLKVFLWSPPIVLWSFCLGLDAERMEWDPAWYTCRNGHSPWDPLSTFVNSSFHHEPPHCGQTRQSTLNRLDVQL